VTKINAEKSIAKMRIVIDSSMFEKVLDELPFLFLFCLIPFLLFVLILILTDKISFDFILIVAIGIPFIIWFLLGYINRGKLYLVDWVPQEIILKWLSVNLSNGNFKGLLENKIIGNGIAVRISGMNSNVYARELYILRKEEKIYVTSVAIGIHWSDISFSFFF